MLSEMLSFKQASKGYYGEVVTNVTNVGYTFGYRVWPYRKPTFTACSPAVTKKVEKQHIALGKFSHTQHFRERKERIRVCGKFPVENEFIFGYTVTRAVWPYPVRENGVTKAVTKA